MGRAYEDDFLFGVREVADGIEPTEYGLFCALPSPSSPDDVVREPRDGEDIRVGEFRGLVIRFAKDKEPMAEARDIKGRMLITDARVALACTKYDTSGDFVSVTGFAGKALAARRRRGKMLVSHVRYPWLASVYGQNREGFRTPETVRLALDLTHKGQKPRVLVDIRLPKQADAVALASEIIRRAARFRLAHEPGLESPEGAELREELTKYAELPDLVYDKSGDQMAGVVFSNSWALESDDAALFGSGLAERPDVLGAFKGFSEADE